MKLHEQEQIDWDSIELKPTDTAKPDAGKPKPDVVKPKPDAGKPKPDVVKPKPDAGKPKHGGYVDAIIAEKKEINRFIMNGIQFYSTLLTYLDSYDIDEEAVQKLFSRRLPSVHHARYCDLIFRITNPTGKLAAAIYKNSKKFNYFLSRNFTSSSISYLRGFKLKSHALNNSFTSLNNLFDQNLDFYDYVIEDIPLVTMNKLSGIGVIKNIGSGKSPIWQTAFKPFTDQYIIQLVNTIYDNQVYGKPQSYLK
jgi:hypothetical protein